MKPSGCRTAANVSCPPAMSPISSTAWSLSTSSRSPESSRLEMLLRRSCIGILRLECLANDALQVVGAQGGVEWHAECLEELSHLAFGDRVRVEDGVAGRQVEVARLLEAEPQVDLIGVVEERAAHRLQRRRRPVLLRDQDVAGGQVVAEGRHGAAEAELDVEQRVPVPVVGRRQDGRVGLVADPLGGPGLPEPVGPGGEGGAVAAVAGADVHVGGVEDLDGDAPRLLVLEGVLAVGRERDGPQERSRAALVDPARSEEHTSELQSRPHLVCRLLLEKKNKKDMNLRSLSKNNSNMIKNYLIHHN